ncbi:MAG TPA: hypothetical protein VMI12_09075 [Puia sp.]|nr:hypothetical protein [Puia sp.]
MNWKLIFQLSLFGLAMAFATVSLIPSNIEPAFWFVIFLTCGYLIAKNCSSKFFLHGFLVSMVNCIWITGAHVFFYNSYISHHQQTASMSAQMPLHNHPRVLMLLMGPIFGAAFGIVLGLFAFIASKVVKKAKPAS